MLHLKKFHLLLIVLTDGGVSNFVAKYLIKIQKCICFNSVTDEVPEIEILAPSNSLQIPTYWQWKYQRKDKIFELKEKIFKLKADGKDASKYFPCTTAGNWC